MKQVFKSVHTGNDPAPDDAMQGLRFKKFNNAVKNALEEILREFYLGHIEYRQIHCTSFLATCEDKKTTSITFSPAIITKNWQQDGKPKFLKGSFAVPHWRAFWHCFMIWIW